MGTIVGWTGTGEFRPLGGADPVSGVDAPLLTADGLKGFSDDVDLDLSGTIMLSNNPSMSLANEATGVGAGGGCAVVVPKISIELASKRLT